MWDSIIYNYLKKRDIVIPPKKKVDKSEKYAGAYVKEPKPGSYDWVVSFDLYSLYPHLIMLYNISPETLRETRHSSASVTRLLEKEIDIDGEYAVCANGAQYRKDVRGFLPELMDKIYGENELHTKSECLRPNKSMKRHLQRALKKKSLDVTTFKWRRRYNLIVLMALSVITSLGIIS